MVHDCRIKHCWSRNFTIRYHSGGFLFFGHKIKIYLRGMIDKMLRKIFCCFIVCLGFASSVNAAFITSPFGWREHPISGERKFHTGLDIGYDQGDPIYAMLAGNVVYAAEWSGYGKCIILSHAGGDKTLYAHCSAINVNVGEYVDKGQVIGAVGSTGYTTGPHLHLEWWHNGEYADPLGLWGL